MQYKLHLTVHNSQLTTHSLQLAKCVPKIIWRDMSDDGDWERNCEGLVILIGWLHAIMPYSHAWYTYLLRLIFNQEHLITTCDNHQIMWYGLQGAIHFRRVIDDLSSDPVIFREYVCEFSDISQSIHKDRF